MEMKEFFNFDEIFGDFEFNNEFMKSIKREFNEIENMIKSGKLRGKWDVKKIDEPGRKGYVIQGRFWSDQPLEPLEPFNPFEPLNPVRRRPVPKRPFEIKEGDLKETREPLTDVFEEDETVKIYVELPGENKDDIQLNVSVGKVEVKAKNFYKMIDLPTSNVNLENAASKYKNGVLEVTIPKNKKTHEKDTRKISID
jgi:HSP20 family molecular chaperone IbpA